MSNNQTGGVQGNTPQSLTQAAGAASTPARDDFRKDLYRWGVYGLATVALALVVFIYTTAGIRFGGLILTGVVALYVGNKLRQEPDRSIGAFVVYAASALIAAVLIMSPVVQKPLELLNHGVAKLEETPIEEMFVSCPDDVYITKDNRPVMEVPMGCTQEVTVSVPWDPQYGTRDGSFEGALEEYVKIEWTSHNHMRLTPKDGTFPDGHDFIRIEVFTPEEAAHFNRRKP